MPVSATTAAIDADPIRIPAAAPHRIMPVGDAIAVGFADLARLGVTSRVETMPGEFFSTHRCSLHGRDGRVVGRSTGKGMGAQSLASALFEAIELYFTAADQNRLSVDTGDVAVLPAAQIARQPHLGKDLVIQRLARQQPQAPVGCARMLAFNVSGDVQDGVWYPLMLTDPGYSMHPLPGDRLEAAPSLRRYCTSSGTAAGITQDEALVHALCEWIEYDAISHALLRWYVTKTQRPAIVDPRSLPPRLSLLADQISALLGTEIVLIDITTDLGMPSFFTTPFRPVTTAALWGAGAAPDPYYAAERALSELLQVATVHLSDREHFDHSHRQMMSRLVSWPALQAACRCDIASLFAGGEPDLVPLRQLSPAESEVLDEAPGDLVDRLVRQLADHGFPCLMTPLSHNNVTTQVVSVRVPGLDRFGGQAIAGYPVLPTGRAMSLWPRN